MFWDKISYEVKCICEATGRSIDDVTLIVHMVLQEIVDYSRKPEHMHESW